jgi:hypothetical protein
MERWPLVQRLVTSVALAADEPLSAGADETHLHASLAGQGRRHVGQSPHDARGALTICWKGAVPRAAVFDVTNSCEQEGSDIAVAVVRDHVPVPPNVTTL